MINDNIVKLTDGYKLDHWQEYPPGTTNVYSYLEARKGQPRPGGDDVVFFGLQYYLMRYLAGQVVTGAKISQAKQRIDRYMPGVFNEAGWRHVLREHRGRLPLRIRALPEGTVARPGIPLATVESTCPKCFWLVGHVETLLVETWYPTIVATNSRATKKVISYYLRRTGSPEDGLNYKLHDFGFRGSTSPESAGIGGAAHLVNFEGTDTLPAMDVASDYYGAEVGGSVPAMEHSTVTAWGRDEREAFRNMLDKHPSGLVAVVSDSYDIRRAVRDYWGKDLRDRVMARDGIVVVRPDSPWEPGMDVPRTVREVVRGLMEAYGTVPTVTGHRLLDPHVRVIQGDGVDLEIIGETLEHLSVNSIAADNVAFGEGGGLLQKVNRDDLGFAFKASEVTICGERRFVNKSPVGDPGKASKMGRFAVWHWDGLIRYGPEHDGDRYGNLLETVFLDGDVTMQSFAGVRERAKI